MADGRERRRRMGRESGGQMSRDRWRDRGREREVVSHMINSPSDRHKVSRRELAFIFLVA